MIQKKLKMDTRRSLHDCFIVMLRDSLREKSKFNTGEILVKYFLIAFGQDIVETDFNKNLIDNIRLKLLINNGLTRLPKSKMIDFIKAEIQF